MPSAASSETLPSLAPPAVGVTWRDAAVLVIVLVAFVWASDIQGVIFYRGEFTTWGHWLQPGLAYVFAAGLALWQWDWVARVFLHWRFASLAVVAIAAIAVASSESSAPSESGVPVLRAGARDRRPVVAHAVPGASLADWVTPTLSHADIEEQAEAGSQDTSSPSFVFDLPPGWSELPATSARRVNLRVGGDARAECYLSSLPGQAGGLLDNVNRWRHQMGLAPIDAEALAKLPRTKLLQREAVTIELDGTFTGMSAAPLENARMVGAIAALPAVTLFLKMTGPRDVVGRERAGFDKVLTSLRLPDPSSVRPPVKPNTDPAKTEAAPPAPPSVDADNQAEGLRWNVPDGWQPAGERMMRLVTLNPKSGTEVECYVSVLPGAAGGVVENVNRWLGQFAQAAVTQVEIDKWDKVKVLGKDAPIVEATGTFTGMGGGPKSGQSLLGTLVTLDDRVVFIKMTGPQAQVQAERERFLTFCRSLSSP